LSACSSPAVEDLPAADTTLASVGKRLSRSMSLDELTAVAGHGERLLAVLTRAERDSLGRNYLRFRVDRRVVVELAAPESAPPFWLKEQGFTRAAANLKVAGSSWALFQKEFDPGWVGLGVNALDRSAPDHYAVFVRARDGNPVVVKVLDDQHWRTVTVAEGTSLASDVRRVAARLPDHLRGVLLLQPARDRRYSTLLARGRVWKTHVPSRVKPDQIAIAFGADAARALVWTWRTDPSASGSAVRLAQAAKDGLGPADPSRVRIVQGEAHPIDTPDLLNDPQVLRHSAAVTDLEPGTAYAYSVGDGTSTGWSPWGVVRTGPANPGRFSLLYLGDAQCGLEGWGKLLEAAYRHCPEAGAVLLAGDLVDRGNERTNWDHFFLRAAGVFDRVPFMPCVGNHEYLDQGPRLYRAFFELPGNGPPEVDSRLVYSFRYGAAFIAVVDSTLAVSHPRMARVQAEWLDRELGRSREDWKLVMFHHPVFASHTTRESPALRDAWVPVFDKHRVDLVLQGHDHAYLRTYPMRGGQRVGPGEHGTTYVVSVSGDKYYDQNPRDYTEFGTTHVSTYQTLEFDVAAGRLTYVARDIRGTEIDRFVIDKRASYPQITQRDDSPAKRR
jgi:hypothetical protein